MDQVVIWYGIAIASDIAEHAYQCAKLGSQTWNRLLVYAH